MSCCADDGCADNGPSKKELAAIELSETESDEDV